MVEGRLRVHNLGNSSSVDQEMTPFAAIMITVDGILFFFSVVCFAMFSFCTCCRKLHKRRKSKVDPSEDAFIETDFTSDDAYISQLKMGRLKDDILVISNNRKIKPFGTLILFLFRLLILVFYIVNESISIKDYIAENDHFEHLTAVSYLFFGLTYILTTSCTLFYFFYLLLCTTQKTRVIPYKTTKWILYVTNYILTIFFEIAIINNMIVAVAFWGIQLPYDMINDVGMTDILNYFSYMSLNKHLLSFVVMFVEFAVMINFKFKFAHLTIPGIFGLAYIAWATILVKSKVIEEFPYDGLLSYDQNWWVPFVKYGLFVCYSVFFMFFYAATFVRKKIVRKWLWCNNCCREEEDDQEFLQERYELLELMDTHERDTDITY